MKSCLLLTTVSLSLISMVFCEAASVDELYESFWQAVESESGAKITRPVLDEIKPSDIGSLAGSWNFTAYPGTSLEEKCSITIFEDQKFKAFAGGGERTGSLELVNSKIVLLSGPDKEFWTCIVKVGGKWHILYASSDTGLLELVR